MNFVSDHMTLLVSPGLYKITYAFMRIVMGVGKDGIVYEKRKRWPGSRGESSMTFAVNIGEVAKEKSPKMARTMIAVVQPTEPQGQSSHVREMLASHSASAHWQHVALRTPDLIGFYNHALAHGVNFITPIMQDKEEDLLQVFSGELYMPGAEPTGLFYEFVQRDVTPALLNKVKKMDRQTWFRDKTFLGLYGEKEQEYQRGRVTPILDHALMDQIQNLWADKEIWQITEADVEKAAAVMREYARQNNKVAVSA